MVTPPRRSLLAAVFIALSLSGLGDSPKPKPRLFIAGDSTAANDGEGGPIGWGVVLPEYFNGDKVAVVNAARGGRSSRTFVTEGLWRGIADQLQPGDVVLIQFGHNDPGLINDAKRARGSLPGLGLETQEIDNLQTGKHEVVRTFGWYMRSMIDEAKAKGAVAIVLSPTVRNIWTGNVEERGPGDYRDLSRQVAEGEHVQFLNLTDLVADEFERRGPKVVAAYFPKDHTHTNNDGAEVNATWVVAGLKALGIYPWAESFSEKGSAVPPAFQLWAQRPPLGWNSWDPFGTGITEQQAREQAKIMQTVLAPHGWSVFTVDIQWYAPNAKGFNYEKDAAVAIDSAGRPVPAENRFPSAKGGAGFRPLAAYVHSLGLKFGIHLMRGIPRAAVAAHVKIDGTDIDAASIADQKDVCRWNPDMYGVDMSKPGAQEYYDSVFQLIASWGVDYVKIDDMASPYHRAEIEGVRKAIDRWRRPIVLSLSPGATPLAEGSHVASQANLWRISDDFWDNWKALKEQFARLDQWTPYRAAGHYPDADMLPLGTVHLGRSTHFSADEQKTLVTLWSISGSPLILGSDLTRLDPATTALLTNDQVLAVDQVSEDNRQVLRAGEEVVWMARSSVSKDRYAAVFNTGETELTGAVALKDLHLEGSFEVTDVWSGAPLGQQEKAIAFRLPAHGAALFRIKPIHMVERHEEAPPPPPPGAK